MSMIQSQSCEAFYPLFPFQRPIELASGPTYKYHTLHMLHVTPQNMSTGPTALMCDNDIQETL